jgi:hypothetical protein
MTIYFLFIIKHHAMKTYSEAAIYLLTLVSTLVGTPWSASNPDSFTSGSQRIGRWVGP